MNEEQNREIPRKTEISYHRPLFRTRRDIEPADLKKMLDDVLDRQKTVPSFNPKEHKDKTRSKIALVFTYGYFITIAICLVGVPLYNAIIGNFKLNTPPLDLKDTILVIGSTLGSTFGFVLGYYFKGTEQE